MALKYRSVYVASSWKNNYLPGIVHILRRCGLEVYDFREPSPGQKGFSWKEVAPDWENWTPSQWRDALKSSQAMAGFRRDLDAMEKADLCLLVLPSGRSAHLEAGYMAGKGKAVLTLALESSGADLMSLLLHAPE